MNRTPNKQRRPKNLASKIESSVYNSISNTTATPRKKSPSPISKSPVPSLPPASQVKAKRQILSPKKSPKHIFSDHSEIHLKTCNEEKILSSPQEHARYIQNYKVWLSRANDKSNRSMSRSKSQPPASAESKINKRMSLYNPTIDLKLGFLGKDKFSLSDYYKLQAQVTQYKEKIKRLEKEIASLKTQLQAALMNQNDAPGKAPMRRESQLIAIKSEQTILIRQQGELAAKSNQLKKDQANLVAAKTSLEQERDNLKKEKADLRRGLEDLKREQAAMARNMEKLEGEKNALNREKKLMQDELNDLRTAKIGEEQIKEQAVKRRLREAQEAEDRAAEAQLELQKVQNEKQKQLEEIDKAKNQIAQLVKEVVRKKEEAEQHQGDLERIKVLKEDKEDELSDLERKRKEQTRLMEIEKANMRKQLDDLEFEKKEKMKKNEQELNSFLNKKEREMALKEQELEKMKHEKNQAAMGALEEEKARIRREMDVEIQEHKKRKAENEKQLEKLMEEKKMHRKSILEEEMRLAQEEMKKKEELFAKEKQLSDQVLKEKQNLRRASMIDQEKLLREFVERQNKEEELKQKMKEFAKDKEELDKRQEEFEKESSKLKAELRAAKLDKEGIAEERQQWDMERNILKEALEKERERLRKILESDGRQKEQLILEAEKLGPLRVESAMQTSPRSDSGQSLLVLEERVPKSVKGSSRGEDVIQMDKITQKPSMESLLRESQNALNSFDLTKPINEFLFEESSTQPNGQFATGRSDGPGLWESDRNQRSARPTSPKKLTELANRSHRPEESTGKKRRDSNKKIDFKPKNINPNMLFRVDSQIIKEFAETLKKEYTLDGVGPNKEDEKQYEKLENIKAFLYEVYSEEMEKISQKENTENEEENHPKDEIEARVERIYKKIADFSSIFHYAKFLNEMFQGDSTAGTI